MPAAERPGLHVHDADPHQLLVPQGRRQLVFHPQSGFTGFSWFRQGWFEADGGFFFCSRCVFLEDKFEIVNRYGMDFPVNNFYTNILRPILFY